MKVYMIGSSTAHRDLAYRLLFVRIVYFFMFVPYVIFWQEMTEHLTPYSITIDILQKLMCKKFSSVVDVDARSI